MYTTSSSVAEDGRSVQCGFKRPLQYVTKSYWILRERAVVVILRVIFRVNMANLVLAS